MSQPTYLINEIFTSIQGESSYQGIPMLFIRFTGCNLRCAYCDTTYAYNEGKKYTLNELIKIVNNSGFNHVLITGGEPLIQRDLISLLKGIKNKKILIETNGSVDISPFQLENTGLIVDMKTPGSKESNRNNFNNLSILRECDELKFVIMDRYDYNWAKDLIEEYRLTDRDIVINFSPAIPFLKPYLLAEWIVEDRLRVRFNLQIHKIIWGDRRGV